MIDFASVGNVLLMILFISVLIIAHEMGHFWVARWCGVKVERFGFGLPFGPTLWKKKVGDVEYCVHAALFGGYVAFPDDDPDNPLPKDSPERFENKPIWARFAVMVAGVTVNAILGWLLLVWVILGWGFPSADVVIGRTFIDTPATQAGFRSGDVIVAMNGQPVQGFLETDRVLNVVNGINAHAGKPMTMTVMRAKNPEKILKPIPMPDPKDKNAVLPPVKLIVKDIPAETVTLNVTPSKDEGTIGIQMAYKRRYLAVHDPVEASGLALQYVGYVLKLQWHAFGQLFSGKMPLNQLSGPIAIVNVGAKVIQDEGIQDGIRLTAIISIILAVMNLLPIPALDGGHIMFLIIEAIKGSPVNQEFRERVTQYGFMGLLALIVFIFANDIYNLLSQQIPFP